VHAGLQASLAVGLELPTFTEGQQAAASQAVAQFFEETTGSATLLVGVNMVRPTVVSVNLQSITHAAVAASASSDTAKLMQPSTHSKDLQLLVDGAAAKHHETEQGSARSGGNDDIQPQPAAAAASNKSSIGRVIALATLTGVGDVGEALSVAKAMHQICPELLGKGISFTAKGNTCGRQLLDQYQEVLPALAGQVKAANISGKHQQGNAAAEKFVTAVVLPLEVSCGCHCRCASATTRPHSKHSAGIESCGLL